MAQQKSADFAKVSEIDFVQQFTQGINVLQEVLGITRKVEKYPGQVIKTYKVTGELESGAVAEGAEIPLTSYKKEVDKTFELAVEKWRKQTTLEAINDKGYEQAVVDTDEKMVRDIQSSIKKKFFDFVATGTGTASGEGLRGALASTWAELDRLFEDYGLGGGDFIYMVNQKDVAAFLTDKDNYATKADAWGMTYLTQFLGMYDVLVYSGIAEGTVIGTARNNLILYFTNPKNSDLAKAFDFTTDETGLVGVNHSTHYTNLTTDTVAIAGVALYAELIDRIVIGTVTSADETSADEQPAG